jgi:hypothetical protein
MLRSYAEAEHDREVAELERLYEQQARREAEAIATQATLAQQQAEAIALQERQKNETLRAYLRSIGVNPDDL